LIKRIIENEKIEVSIPLTKGAEKVRIKKRPMLNAYGIPVATKTETFSNACYIEWQIGYDVITKDHDKLLLTRFHDKRFIGANGLEKALYELSEYIKLFYDWKIISEGDLSEFEDYIKGIQEEDFIENHKDLKILRQEFEDKKINGFDFLFTRVMYPLLVYKVGNFEIMSEIIIKEKQRARGIMPMLYLCFPITELDNGSSYIGRTAKTKELGTLTIDKNNINVFIEIFKLFGTLSQAHNHDIQKIIECIKK